MAMFVIEAQCVCVCTLISREEKRGQFTVIMSTPRFASKRVFIIYFGALGIVPSLAMT